MKVMNVLASLLLAFCMSAFSQTSDNSGSQMKPDMQKSDSMKTDQQMGKKKTMTGCISQRNGKYLLMDKKHPDGIELTSSEDLAPHVGHKVKVTGMMQAGSTMSGDMKSDNMKNDSDMKSDNTTMKNDNMGMMVMQVEKLKIVSTMCHMKMDKMKQ